MKNERRRGGEEERENLSEKFGLGSEAGVVTKTHWNGPETKCDGRPIALAHYCALEAKAEDEYSMRKSKERTMKECMKKRRGNELPRTAPDNCRGQAKRRLLRVELQSDAMQYVNNNVLQ